MAIDRILLTAPPKASLLTWSFHHISLLPFLLLLIHSRMLAACYFFLKYKYAHKTFLFQIPDAAEHRKCILGIYELFQHWIHGFLFILFVLSAVSCPCCSQRKLIQLFGCARLCLPAMSSSRRSPCMPRIFSPFLFLLPIYWPNSRSSICLSLNVYSSQRLLMALH